MLRHALTGLLPRKKRPSCFTEKLPWLSYDHESETHLLTDNTTATIWEISPLVYQDTPQAVVLEKLLTLDFPVDTVMQFILHPDHNIGSLIDGYTQTKIKTNALGQAVVNEVANHLRSNSMGMDAMQGLSLRHFRGFVVLKSRHDLSALIPAVTEALNKAGLKPRRLDDVELVAWMWTLFSNPSTQTADSAPADDSQGNTVRSIVINADTVIDFRGDTAQIGNRYAACLTPEHMPADITSWRTNNLFGGVMGGYDSAPLNCPFYYSVNILFNDTEQVLSNRATIKPDQSRVGRFARKVHQRLNASPHCCRDAIDEKPPITLIPTLWVLAPNEEQLNRHVDQAKRVWASEETGSFALKREPKANASLFIASLPGGLDNQRSTINALDRHWIMPCETAARFLPVQGDFAGFGRPVTLLAGRKGQLLPLDLFAPGNPNHNFLACGEPSSGRSTFLSTVLGDHHKEGHHIRILDVDGRYEHSCRVAGGQVIQFSPGSNDSNQCMNPLDLLLPVDKDEPLTETYILNNLHSASLVFMEMACTQLQRALTNRERKFLRDATFWAYHADLALKGTDAIAIYLNNITQWPGEASRYQEDDQAIAKHLARSLSPFTSLGPYGKLFVGQSCLYDVCDDYVVVSLRQLEAEPELFSVVLLQVLNMLSQDLCRDLRLGRCIVLCGEAISQLKRHGHVDLSNFIAMIDTGLVLTRPHGGALGIELNNLHNLGNDNPHLYRELVAHTACKYLFPSTHDAYNLAVNKSHWWYKDFIVRLLQSVKSNPPHYTEVFIESGRGSGVARLLTTPLRYWANTTDAQEIATYNALITEGLSPLEAVTFLAENSADLRALLAQKGNEIAMLPVAIRQLLKKAA